MQPPLPTEPITFGFEESRWLRQDIATEQSRANITEFVTPGSFAPYFECGTVVKVHTCFKNPKCSCILNTKRNPQAMSVGHHEVHPVSFRRRTCNDQKNCASCVQGWFSESAGIMAGRIIGLKRHAPSKHKIVLIEVTSQEPSLEEAKCVTNDGARASRKAVERWCREAGFLGGYHMLSLWDVNRDRDGLKHFVAGIVVGKFRPSKAYKYRVIDIHSKKHLSYMISKLMRRIATRDGWHAFASFGLVRKVHEYVQERKLRMCGCGLPMVQYTVHDGALHGKPEFLYDTVKAYTLGSPPQPGEPPPAFP